MYNLYLDKPTEFNCEVSIKNASLKDAFARLIIETKDGLALMFPGKLEDGRCSVPIKRLKGLLDENSRGEVKLEVIVEDTYFSPWKDDFIAEKHTDVKVQIQEQKKPSKPMVEVTTVKNQPKLSEAASDLVYIFEKVGINKDNLNRRKKDFKQVVKEYFKASPEHLKGSKKFISEAVLALK
jgi:hypothetical protein